MIYHNWAVRSFVTIAIHSSESTEWVMIMTCILLGNVKVNESIDLDSTSERVYIVGLIKTEDVGLFFFFFNLRVLIVECVCCFVLLTRGWGRLKTRPPFALGFSPELSAFTMSLAPPVHPSPVTSARGLRKLWRVNRDSHQSKVRDNVVTMLGPYYVLSIGTIQIQIPFEKLGWTDGGPLDLLITHHEWWLTKNYILESINIWRRRSSSARASCFTFF